MENGRAAWSVEEAGENRLAGRQTDRQAGWDPEAQDTKQALIAGTRTQRKTSN